MTAPLRLALAALVATLLAATTLRPLFADLSWTAPVLVVVLVCSLVGVAVRQLTPIWPLAALAQAGALTVTLTALFARRQAVFGILPGPEALDRMGTLLTEGSQVIRTAGPPVPVGAGIVLLATLGMALVAFAVDLVAASLERPAAAGLPLLAVYSVPAAVLPQGVPWIYFLVAALGYLMLVTVDWVDRVHAWGRVLGHGPHERRVNLGGPLSGGRRVAAISLAVAVLLPMVTPGVDERLLTGGDGDGEGRGRGQISVVNPILTLHQNLTSRSNDPVITYTTTMASPDPLRIATDDTFSGERWAPSTGPISRKQKVQDGLPFPPGLSSQVSRRDETTNIAIGKLSETYLPLPYPTTVVEIEGRWLYEKASLNVVGDGQRTDGVSYTARHLSIEPTAEQLAAAPAPPQDLQRTFTALPSLPALVRQTARTVAGTGSHYEQALAIQDYLRTSGGFTYSEKISGPEDGSGTEAVTAFLTGKKGYCVQFASTMAVLSRTLGIPARVAVGFLPGTAKGGGQYTISLQDAHAWPELYFENVGWVRFEPTPARRAPSLPGYAQTDPVAPSAPEATPSASVSASASAGPASRAARPAPERPETSTTATDTSWFDRIPWRILAALASLGLLAAAPWLAGQVIRRRRWSRARTPQLRAEAAWDDLRDRLSDLGVVWARSWTPRALMHRLSHDHTLPAEALAALERLVHDIETARYAPPDAASARTTDQVRADTDRVVEAVGELVGPQARRRARLVPASGIAVFTGSRRALRQQSTGEQEGGLLRVQPRRPRDRRPRERAGSGDRR
ncbi:MAG: transglutaminase [Kineosporiaceae bacterium]|nr:transglutaminase [Kineosporiaceae bacterium]MBK7624583.1 transglutaminase [Kineosporiaceae bacterium]MBK8077047.1 transglutaminase [Kineosporiaceae bacterium]